MTAFVIRLIAWFNARRRNSAIQSVEVDINAKCPGCGHRIGHINCEAAAVKNPDGSEELTVMIRHTCGICRAIWYEKTIVDPKGWAPIPTKK